MRARTSRAVCLAFACAGLASTKPALAIDLGDIKEDPVRLDITETTIGQQRFNAREGGKFIDHGYGGWLNRLNLALRWKRWTAATRLDSSVYWLRPEDRTLPDPSQRDNIIRDGASRYPDAIYPAKLWAQYQSPELEITAGDAYAQFGRGLVLSMRKLDELGVDNTIRGGKVQIRKDPFALQLVAGLANPSRVDEATGRALFLPKAVAGDTRGPQPVFGSDRIVGAQIQAGRGTPVVLSTHAVRLTRCAPYRYTATGSVVDDPLDSPIGSCDARDTEAWLSTIPSSAGGPIINASEVEVAGQSMEIPNLWGHGNLYLEAAVQRRRHDAEPNDPNARGNALYGSFVTNVGIFTNTIELKSYRNFFPLAGAVDISRATAFANVVYSTPPTVEPITQDSMFGFFNACVDGGRARSDVRLSDTVIVYGQGAYYLTKSEVAGGGCDEHGHTISGALSPDDTKNRVWDGLAGVQWQFDNALSQLLAWIGFRDDEKLNGEPFYREAHANYAFTKYLAGPFSIEFIGRHRLRREENQNALAGPGSEEPWVQGENYSALKIAPKWVLSQGFEYTSLAGFPVTYFNGSLLYRFTSESNLKVLVGQQRGGLKCISGVCRIFPPFEGARAELTFRF